MSFTLVQSTAKTTPEISMFDNSNHSVPITSSDLDAQLNFFMLHHSITPTTNLISTSLAGSNNFSSWSRAIVLALSGKNKVGFITGLIKKSSEGNLLSAWKCNIDVIACWIINSISKEIPTSLVYNGNIKEMWDELKESYKQPNVPHIYQLQKNLVTTAQGSLSVEIYYAKITTIW